MASEDNLFYAAAGPFAAIILGVALTPLRDLTPASNLAFAFMALTIVIAELGGGTAALATAAVSALSLDFFLTQPYLRLSIEDKHDVIAFVGLAVCGFLAATLGGYRERRIASLSAAAAYRDLLHSVLRNGDATASLDSRLTRALEAMAKSYPLAGAVVRDADDRVVATASAADSERPIPQQRLDPDTLLPADGGTGAGTPWDPILPREGARIALSAGPERAGWLDVWGDGRPANAAARLALSDLARLIALLLAARGTARGGRP